MPSSLSAELTSRACSEYSAASVLTVSLCGEALPRPLIGTAVAAGGSGGAAWGCTKRPEASGISISGELAAAASRGLTGLGVPCCIWQPECLERPPLSRLPPGRRTGGPDGLGVPITWRTARCGRCTRRSAKGLGRLGLPRSSRLHELKR